MVILLANNGQWHTTCDIPWFVWKIHSPGVRQCHLLESNTNACLPNEPIPLPKRDTNSSPNLLLKFVKQIHFYWACIPVGWTSDWFSPKYDPRCRLKTKEMIDIPNQNLMELVVVQIEEKIVLVVESVWNLESFLASESVPVEVLQCLTQILTIEFPPFSSVLLVAFLLLCYLQPVSSAKEAAIPGAEDIICSLPGTLEAQWARFGDCPCLVGGNCTRLIGGNCARLVGGNCARLVGNCRLVGFNLVLVRTVELCVCWGCPLCGGVIGGGVVLEGAGCWRWRRSTNDSDNIR